MTRSQKTNDFLDWLEATTKRVEEAEAALANPDSPEAKAIKPRAGRRMVERLWKRLDKIRQHGEPTPHHTAPTREREAASGERMAQTVVYDGAGQAMAISHRVVWPVQRLHNLHITNARQYHAAARFRVADDRRDGPAGVASYGDGGRASDPSRRMPITPDQEVALKEFMFVWKRLEDELRTLAWIMILQRPLPGAVEPLSVVEVGKRFGNTENEASARWFAQGMLKLLLVRMSSIYAIYDNHRAKEQEQAEALAAEQVKLHRQRVPLTRIKETA